MTRNLVLILLFSAILRISCYSQINEVWDYKGRMYAVRNQDTIILESFHHRVECDLNILFLTNDSIFKGKDKTITIRGDKLVLRTIKNPDYEIELTLSTEKSLLRREHIKRYYGYEYHNQLKARLLEEEKL